MKKRLLAMLLVLSMVLTCAPGLAMATETGDEPSVLTFEQFKAQATAEGLEALVTLETGEMVMVEGAFEFHVGSATEPVGNVDLSGVTFLIESGEPCRLVIHTTGAVADIEDRTDVEVVVVSYEDEAEEAFVAMIGDEGYETLAAAIAAGGEIDLLADVTLTEVIVIGKDVVINGNGHTVTSSANRIFRVEKSGQKVTMNDLNMVTTAFQVGVSDIRGISVDPSISNVELTLNNCSVKFAPFEGDDWAYAVNICGTSQGHIITINGGEYNGANAINIWGDNHTVNIDGAKLTSLYVDNEMYHGFCVCLEGTGVNLTVKNTVFNGNNAVAIGENANAANNTIVEENNTDNTKRYEKPYVAKIGDTKYDSLKEAMDAAAAADLEDIVIELCADAVYDVAAWAQNGMGGENTKTITINGNGHTLVFNNTNSDWNNVATKNGATLTLNNMTIDNSGHDSDKGTWNAYDINFACDVTMNNVTALNALAFKNGATLNKVKIIDKGLSAAYAIWIRANGQTVTLIDCEIDSTGNVDGRGIKIDEQYLKAEEKGKVTLNVTNTSFATDSKAAIVVKSTEGADITISNIDISKVAADTVNAVWVDKGSAEYADKVTVTGASMIVEGAVASVAGKYYASLQDALDAAAAADLEDIVIELCADAVYDVAAWAQNGMGGENTKTITINGNGHTLVFNNTNSDWNNVATKNGATLTLNNMTIDNSGHDSDKGTWNAYDINFACDVTMNNVTALNALAFKNGATLNKVKIIDKGLSAAYAIWIRANGQTVTLIDCEIDSTGNVDGRGIKIDNEYLKADETAKVTLTVTNTSFATDSKAAILVKSPEGADITINNVDISKVAADTVNAVWVDDAAAEYVDKVTVTGASMIVEGAVATVGGAYYNTLEAAIAAAEAGETVTLLANIAVPVNSAVVVDKKLILDLNGKTINAKGDAIVVEGDADLTVTGNGTVNACVENAAGGCVAVWAVEGGKITIENGTFSVGAVAGDYNDLIYAKGGTIVINGGYFNSENTYHAEQTRYSVLNINDSYIDSSAIVVNGGSFEDFNPDTGDNSVAGDTFVSEGYMVSCTTNGNGNQVYTVVEKKEAEVDPETNTAFAAGEAVGGVSADVTEIEAEDVADAANNADTAEDLVDAAQNTVTVSEEVKEEAAELIEEIYGEGTVTEETPVVVEIRTYLDVMVEEIDVTEMSMTVEIEALYNTVAVVGNKEVVFGETETMNTEGQPITITLPIPAEFADAPYIYVYHYKKDSENNILATYIYQATVFEENGKYFATFVNPHGFSEFAIVVSDEEIDCIQGHTYDNNVDGTCNVCGAHREDVEDRVMKDMFRMYNPNNGVHFYTGSEEERDHLVSVGWNYEGVAFTFPTNTGAPVYRLYNETTGEHRFTMDEDEKDRLMTEGWNYEGIAFNSAYDTEAAQHCLFNPYAVVGAYHYTFSQQEMQDLLEAGWEYKGIGWYSCFG